MCVCGGGRQLYRDTFHSLGCFKRNKKKRDRGRWHERTLTNETPEPPSGTWKSGCHFSDFVCIKDANSEQHGCSPEVVLVGHLQADWLLRYFLLYSVFNFITGLSRQDVLDLPKIYLLEETESEQQLPPDFWHLVTGNSLTSYPGHLGSWPLVWLWSLEFVCPLTLS